MMLNNFQMLSGLTRFTNLRHELAQSVPHALSEEVHTLVQLLLG
jgi:hypothetical protein